MSIPLNLQRWVLPNVAVCTTGEAVGHGVWASEAFLRQVVQAGNARALGIKARWGHPAWPQDPVGTELGRFRRFRMLRQPKLDACLGHTVWQAIADLHLLETPANTTAVRHLLAIAAADPGLLGASLEFRPGPGAHTPNPKGLPTQTVNSLLAVALTSDPACNPAGLLA